VNGALGFTLAPAGVAAGAVLGAGVEAGVAGGALGVAGAAAGAAGATGGAGGWDDPGVVDGVAVTSGGTTLLFGL